MFAGFEPVADRVPLGGDWPASQSWRLDFWRLGWAHRRMWLPINLAVRAPFLVVHPGKLRLSCGYVYIDGRNSRRLAV